MLQPDALIRKEMQVKKIALNLGWIGAELSPNKANSSSSSVPGLIGEEYYCKRRIIKDRKIIFGEMSFDVMSPMKHCLKVKLELKFFNLIYSNRIIIQT